MTQHKTKLMTAGLVAVGLVLGSATLASADSTAHLKEPLTPTSTFSEASGTARLKLHAQKHKGTKGTRGSFTVAAKHLPKDTTFDLIVGGAKVGTLHTNRLGNGSDVFSTTPRGRAALLGIDPRGKTVLLRDPSGTGSDVLVGTIPDDDQGSQACCTIASDGEAECDDVSPDPATGVVACNGTIPTDASGAPISSCLPDPCNTSAPPPNPPSGSGTTTVCCVLDSHDAEATQTQCDDSLGECAANGGALVEVQLPASFQEGDNPCDLNPDPCQSATTTPPPPNSLCCVPHNSGNPTEVEAPECEDLSSDACTAIGGAPPVNGACAYTDQSGAAASIPCP